MEKLSPTWNNIILLAKSAANDIIPNISTQIAHQETLLWESETYVTFRIPVDYKAVTQINERVAEVICSAGYGNTDLVVMFGVLS